MVFGGGDLDAEIIKKCCSKKKYNCIKMQRL